ncbi:MAG: Na+/H+ antiporter [Acidobacteriaceae bacterium]
MHGIARIEIIILLLSVFVVGFGALARWLKVPYPIVMVLGGLILSLVPGMPKVRLEPQIVFFALLPPLLFSAAIYTSWRDFRYNLVSILMLAFGLVAFTALGIALFAHWVIPGLDWKLGFVLGALLSPTDAIAATAIARKLKLQHGITDIIEGESLVNDGTGLLLLTFATTIVVSGKMPSPGSAAWQLAWMLAGGVGAGLALAVAIHWIEIHLNDPPIEITLSLATPFAAYLLAEAMHASGVLAAVSCGVYLGYQSARFFSSHSRLDAHGVWSTLTFLLNGLVFLLIGLQLPQAVHGIQAMGRGELLLDALELALAMVALRMLWVFPGAYIAYWVRRHLLRQREQRPRVGQIFIVGWTGMRGVVALAAALALPFQLADGRPFPQRGLILFLTFSAILFSLVVQGLSLPWLIRKLKLSGTAEGEQERRAREAIIQAGLKFLKQNHPGKEDERKRAAFDRYCDIYEERLQRVREEEQDVGDDDKGALQIYRDLGKRLRAAERKTALEFRDRGEISDHTLRKLMRELDLLDTRYDDVEH